MAHALPTLIAGQSAAVPASTAMLFDESVEDSSFHVHSSAECTTSSSLLDELVSPSCPIMCKIASSASMPIQNQLNSNDLEYHKKYPNVMEPTTIVHVVWKILESRGVSEFQIILGQK